MTDAVAQAGCVAGSAGLLVLVLGTRRASRLCGAAALVAGTSMLGWALAAGHRGALAGVVCGLLAAAALLAVVLVHRPWLLPFLALAALPFRVRVDAAGLHSELLLPLYVVVAGAAVALLWELPAEERRPRELDAVGLPLALLVGWLGLSSLWADDVHAAAVELLAYVLPFGLLALALARVPWSRRRLGALAVQLGAMGAAFAAVGVAQWLARDVVWAPAQLTPGAFVGVFHADSVFADPSRYARFELVAVLGTLAATVVARPRGWLLAAAVAAVALGWAGLYVADTPEALAALVVGAALTATLVWRPALVLAPALAAAVVVAAAPALRSGAVTLWDDAASGRAAVVQATARVAGDHLVAGVGAGGVAVAVAGVRPEQEPWRSAPVTAAAEAGVVGALLLAWLVAEALLAAFRSARPLPTTRVGPAFGIMIVAIVVHSVFVDSLLEDPLLWALLALAAIARGVRAPA